LLFQGCSREVKKNDDNPLPSPKPAEDDLRSSDSLSFYEPDHGWMNRFDGLSWQIRVNFIETEDSPGAPIKAGLNTVSSCYQKYGESIRHWGEKYKVHFAHIIATILTESSCTNVSGSSDGKSTGLMQVTKRNCVHHAKELGINGLSEQACGEKMYRDTGFAIQLGTKHMTQTYLKKQISFTPLVQQKDTTYSFFDPILLSAAYNSGSIRQSSKNKWHMIMTGDHVGRFLKNYNGFVELVKSEARGFSLTDSIKTPIIDNPKLPFSVKTFKELSSLEAEVGNIIFVGEKKNEGSFYILTVDQGWVDTMEY